MLALTLMLEATNPWMVFHQHTLLGNLGVRWTFGGRRREGLSWVKKYGALCYLASLLGTPLRHGAGSFRPSGQCDSAHNIAGRLHVPATAAVLANGGLWSGEPASFDNRRPGLSAASNCPAGGLSRSPLVLLQWRTVAAVQGVSPPPVGTTARPGKHRWPLGGASSRRS